MREVEWRMMPAKVSFDGWDENMDVRVAACGNNIWDIGGQSNA